MTNALTSWHSAPGYKFSDMTDGTANTIAMSENCIGRNRSNYLRGGVVPNAGDQWNGTPLANCMSKIGTNGQYNTGGVDWRGMRWADGGVVYTGFTTIIPPNGPSCISGGGDADSGWVTATSYHPGGVLVVMGDASTRFISNDINCGNLAVKAVTAGESPYGVWGALGTRNGGETTDNR